MTKKIYQLAKGDILETMVYNMDRGYRNEAYELLITEVTLPQYHWEENITTTVTIATVDPDYIRYNSIILDHKSNIQYLKGYGDDYDDFYGSINDLSVKFEKGEFVITDSRNNTTIGINDTILLTEYGNKVLGEYFKDEVEEDDDSLTFNDHLAELEGDKSVITYPEDTSTKYSPEILHGFVIMSPMDNPTMSGNHVSFNPMLDDSTICSEHGICYNDIHTL